MNNFSYLRGDLVTLAKTNQFDVILIGANCKFSRQSQLAYGLARVYNLSNEGSAVPNMGHLANISAKYSPTGGHHTVLCEAVVMHDDDLAKQPFDYDAYKVCMKKVNSSWHDCKIAMPKIGCHLAGGDWDILEQITKTLLKDCDVTIVEYNG